MEKQSRAVPRIGVHPLFQLLPLSLANFSTFNGDGNGAQSPFLGNSKWTREKEWGKKGEKTNRVVGQLSGQKEVHSASIQGKDEMIRVVGGPLCHGPQKEWRRMDEEWEKKRSKEKVHPKRLGPHSFPTLPSPFSKSDT